MRNSFADQLKEDGKLIIPQSLSPVVKMGKLTKSELYELTKSWNRQKNLKAYMKKMRLARRNSMDKTRKKRREELDAEARNKLKIILEEFLECRTKNDDMLCREIAIFKPKHLKRADIDRECSFSETSSNAGSNLGESSRPRRCVVAPERFTASSSTKPRGQKKEQKIDSDATFEVEYICDINLINNQVFMQVKWEKYSTKFNTWEPLENVRDCEALEQFLEQEVIGEEEKINAMCQELLNEQEQELAMYKEKPKSVIMQELKQFDPLEYKCCQLIYNCVRGETSFYNNFRRKMRHMVILNYFHELDVIQHEAHKKIKHDIMEKEKNEFTVAIINDIDFSVMEYFNYVRENVFPVDQNHNDQSKAQGCNCKDGCSRESKCCPSFVKGAHFAYKYVSDKKRLRLSRTQMIYECNENCSCGASCLNRVTQQPRLFPMQIFKTDDGRGWGLKTTVNIPKGAFLVEYTGEIIDQQESIRRGEKYDEIGRSYLFDFDFNDDLDAVYTVDAFSAGNLSRLINHSCEPNCRIWPVATCNSDPHIYKLCYFSSRMIKAGEELTFDYNGGVPTETEDKEDDIEGVAGNNIVTRHKTIDSCKCGSENCRGFIFSV